MIRGLCAVALALLPIGIIYLLRDQISEVYLPSVIPAAPPHYPEAVERYESISGTLVTITLSILAATGYVILNRKPLLPRLTYVLAYLVFIFVIVSVFYAIRLGDSAGISLGTNTPDIVLLSGLLDAQAVTALVSACLLSAVIVTTGVSIDHA